MEHDDDVKHILCYACWGSLITLPCISLPQESQNPGRNSKSAANLLHITRAEPWFSLEGLRKTLSTFQHPPRNSSRALDGFEFGFLRRLASRKQQPIIQPTNDNLPRPRNCAQTQGGQLSARQHVLEHRHASTIVLQFYKNHHEAS